MRIHVIGLQRTGTNYVSELWKNNSQYFVFPSGDRNICWKHALPLEKNINGTPSIEMLKSQIDIHVMVVAKHPLNWLSSVLNRNPADLFIKRPHLKKNGEPSVDALLNLYKTFYLRWIKCLTERQLEGGGNFSVVRYEQCLADPASCFSHLGSAFISKSGSSWVFPEKWTAPQRVPFSDASSKARVSGYIEGKFDVSEDVLCQYKQNIDGDVLNKLGYEVMPRNLRVDQAVASMEHERRLGPQISPVLVYTCVNRAYEDFAPLYAVSALTANPSAVCEIGLENLEEFRASNGASIDLIEKYFPGRCVWTEVVFPENVLPNTVRFITEPQTVADYIYIGDVDIIMLQKDFHVAHLEHMKRTNLDYSNCVRPGTKRMSGLHFTKFSAYFPLPDLSGIDITKNDEVVLYEILRLKGVEVEPKIEWFRPVHGIHASPNRQPLGSVIGGKKIPGWGMNGWIESYAEFAGNSVTREVRPLLSARVREILAYLDGFSRLNLGVGVRSRSDGRA